ncbi:uncharacterized protein LOC125852496 [Solanum stenotomum]|uniref:uncharacterized protein LOC125852496 n=1 Tax=Solanum stenotomum TaxID=172797 RepID=UPI0020D039B4|nr:uncharacterized protein LOC125852496 [Solanum stenotomum]
MAANIENSDIEICNVISESKRIATSQRRHFRALSLLFLFPLSIFTYLFLNFEKTIIISFILALFVIISAFCAVATITYSTFHGYNGQPIDLSSILFSIFPLSLPFLSTFTLLLLIVALISICLGLVFLLISKGILLKGFDMNLNSFYFNSYVSIMIVVGIFLDMKWMLANVIIVAEGKRCYEPLRRSAYLMKKVKWGVILSFQFLSVAPVGLFFWNCGTFWLIHTGGWSKWLNVVSFAMDLVIYSAFLTLFLLSSLVRNVILYVQCKALCGEFLEDLPPYDVIL